MRSRPTNSGKNLNEKWRVGARHALYRKTGDWYMHLEYFPGALFDPNGYILFDTEEQFRNCAYLKIGKRVHVSGGISKIPGYVKMR